MYGVDCDQLSNVADQAISLGFRLTLGVYIDSSGTVRGEADLDAIITWGKLDSVDIILIGM
jgi:exo-beta-1,3-glucanase (GH17 family)